MGARTDGVPLGVVRAGLYQLVAEYFTQMFPESAGEFFIPIREDGPRDAECQDDVLQ